MSKRLLLLLSIILAIFIFGLVILKANKTNGDIQNVSLKSGDYFFTPSTIYAKMNQTLNISIDNTGDHTFVISEFNFRKVLGEGVNTFKIKFTKSGIFTFFCDVTGHRQAGQFGTLFVE